MLNNNENKNIYIYKYAGTYLRIRYFVISFRQYPRNGLLATGAIHFGTSFTSEHKRVPRPPANIITSI